MGVNFVEDMRISRLARHAQRLVKGRTPSRQSYKRVFQQAF